MKVPKLELSEGEPAMILTPMDQAKNDQPRQYPLEINLDFELFNGVDEPSQGTKEQLMSIVKLFPNCVGVGVTGIFIQLRFSTLPPKPWPVKIAGLAAWFTGAPMISANSYLVSPRGRAGRGPPLSIEADLQRWRVPTTETLMVVIQELGKRGFESVGAQFWGAYLVVQISGTEPAGLQSRFPKQINGFHARYTYENPLTSESAPRVGQPTDAEPDNEPYEACLRPGVMLTGANSAGEVLSTTSGVCVVDSAGKKFVTCASRGFLPGDGHVYHPSLQGRLVRKIKRTFESTDISLFGTEAGINYLNETFSEIDSKAEPFRNIRDPKSLRFGDIVSMNTPFNGLCEGVYMASFVGPLPTDEPGLPHQYFRSDISYFGQTTDRLVDGCCGAPIFTQDFEVVGQFRFVELDGVVCWGSSYEPLLQGGYKLADVE